MEQTKKEHYYSIACEIATNDSECHFIDDIVASMPINRSSFYEYFPANSDELDNLKALIQQNKIKTKKYLRNKWKTSDNATTEIALYKLMSTEEEFNKIANIKPETKSDTNKIEVTFSRES